MTELTLALQRAQTRDEVIDVFTRLLHEVSDRTGAMRYMVLGMCAAASSGEILDIYAVQRMIDDFQAWFLNIGNVVDDVRQDEVESVKFH